MSKYILGDDIVLPSDADKGIRGGTSASNDWEWDDLKGIWLPFAAGAGRPALSAWKGGIDAFKFAAGDKVTMVFHIGHDWVPNHDCHIHVHWDHQGTAISGSLVCDLELSYAKGHDQANFGANVIPQVSVSTPDISTIPQGRHRIDEVQLSAASPSASQLDSNNIEPDGLVIGTFTATTVPAVTGGNGGPFIHHVDIHYQSRGRGSKNRTFPFYS